MRWFFGLDPLPATFLIFFRRNINTCNIMPTQVFILFPWCNPPECYKILRLSRLQRLLMETP